MGGSSRGVTGKLSPHFTAREFSCPHCGVTLVRPRLLVQLEQLRDRLQRPVPIVSGYRCPVHNLAAGGATNSQHMYGAAADLPHGLVPVSLARSLFNGVGISGAWAVHVDVRDGGPAQWTY
jgi:uncharacterized protein YcbK (DUF882 family)